MKKKEQSLHKYTGKYFTYFYHLVGYRMFIYLILNFLVGLFDGLGLAMFIPLLSLATGTAKSNESLGKLKFVIDFLQKINVELNLRNALFLMVLLFITKGIFYFIKIIFFTKIKLFAIRKIRLGLLEDMGNVSYNGFTRIDAGRIQSNMIGETQRLLQALVQYFNTLQNIVMVITYVILAFLSNWQFALMVAFGAFITNFIYTYINKITKENSRKISYEGYDFNGNLIQTVNNFKYLKATNYYRIFDQKMRKNVEVTEGISFKIGKIGAYAESLREPMIIIIIAIVILVQIEFLNNNFASILVSLLLFYRSLGHLVNMQNSWNYFMSASAGLESIENIKEDFKKNKEPFYTHKINSIKDISLKDVSVIYENKKVLDQINLDIKDKSAIALVGESGAGKTTLANVICGLTTPNEGKVIIENANLYETNLPLFRDKIGYITQEPVIFNDSIYNNITFWAEKNTENFKKFSEVIKMVSLENFLQQLPDKEDAPLGDNGVLISGGQKQRISIARELYKNVELLIMDEATSALDSETEKHIKDNIDLLHGRFTMVIIAHRLSTIKNVDIIYLMENGKIINSGNYEELMKKSEKFRKMVELQLL